MTSRATVLVTGASGFVATHAILQLLERGYAVRGTLRTPERAESLRAVIAGAGADPAGLDFVTADLAGDAGWAEAAAGCRYVLHVASPIGAKQPRDPNDFIAPARDGARRVIEAAIEAGTERVVMTSSIAAVCYGRTAPLMRRFTEEDWTDPMAPTTTPYTKSKTLAEREAWRVVEHDGGATSLATVNPGLILGPVLEKDYGSSAEVVRKLMSGRLPACPRLGWPVVDVRDVAAMHIAAMETPAAGGHRFLCGNDFMWIREIAAVLRHRFPDYRRRIPKLPAPDVLVRLFALFDAQARALASELGQRKDLDTTKAREILNWQPRPNEEAICATAETLIRFGIVKAP